MKTLRVLAVAAVLAVAFAVPVTAQEPGDSVMYEGDPFPVWVLVEDADEAGAHRVEVMVRWDDYRSILRFATDVWPGELLVFLPTSEDSEDITDSCVFASGFMAHESQDRHAMEPEDANCTGPPVAALPFVAVEHSGDPLACSLAERTDGGAEDPARRLFACYFDREPGG